ncbi:MAG: beta-ketoacyl synthase N-terminal-like domain-containing protein, partial [Pseudomonadota bacterium]
MNNNKYQHRLQRAAELIDRLQKRLDEIQALPSNQKQANSDIAITGMACRFPGGINSPNEFWNSLLNNHDGITKVPNDRWDADALYHSDYRKIGHIVTRNGGFLDDPKKFDASFFGISPKEAATLDPQQRLLLEVGWHALEDAGIVPAKQDDKTVGIFIGISSQDYSQQLLSRDLDEQDAYVATGNAHSVAAGRLSYCFGFTGPSIVVDTACSSSLVAVHLACQSLQAGECDIALVGGVNRILNPDGSVIFSRAQMISPDGRCKVFDAKADGFTRAEGCGMVVMKRKGDLKIDDNHLATILGSAVNQDGRSSGLTVPNGPSQQKVIRAALKKAGLTHDDIDYIEAHGTGTSLGDPIEVGSIAEVFAGREHPILLGSVKANLGHMEAAAGIGGLIKTVLAMQHRVIPRQIHFETPNPHIHWGQRRNSEPLVQVACPQTVWPDYRGNELPQAGISSFGFSGTNAHVILQGISNHSKSYDEISKGKDLLLLSAHNESALNELAKAYKQELTNWESAGISWQMLCRNTIQNRGQFSQRLALSAESYSEANKALQAYLDQNKNDHLYSHFDLKQDRLFKSKKLAFVFTGQGSQWPKMGKALYENHGTFRQVIDECDAWVCSQLDWSLKHLLFESDSELLAQTQFTQPAIFSIQCALFKTLTAWGIQPQAVLGHSIGEFAAAVCAGSLSLLDGLKLVTTRGKLMQELPSDGGMLIVRLAANKCEDHLASWNSNNTGEICIAADNGPELCVISGSLKDLDKFASILKQDYVMTMALEVSHAFHSTLMSPMTEEFSLQLKDINHDHMKMAFYSTLTGDDLRNSEYKMLNLDYWHNHILHPVRFCEASNALINDGYTHIVEIGPQPHLSSMLKSVDVSDDLTILSCMRQDESDLTSLYKSLATLFVEGWDLMPTQLTQAVALPNYPFQHQPYWYSCKPTSKQSVSIRQNDKELLGHHLPLPGSVEQRYHSRWNINTREWFADHDVFGVPVLPATSFIALSLKMGEKLYQNKALAIENIDFHQALLIDKELEIQSVIADKSNKGNQAYFQIFSRDPQLSEDDWQLHAGGTMINTEIDACQTTISMNEWQTQCKSEVDVEDCYRKLKKQNIGYGDLFKAQQRIFIDQESRRVFSKISLSSKLRAELKEFTLHPILLDACLQSIVGLFLDQESTQSYLPASVNKITLCTELHDVIDNCYCALQVDDSAETLLADLAIFDDKENIIVCIHGLQLRRANLQQLKSSNNSNLAELPQNSNESYEEWLYRIHWRPTLAPSSNQFSHPKKQFAKLIPRFSDQLAKPENQLYLNCLKDLNKLAIAYAAYILHELEITDDLIITEHKALFGRIKLLAANTKAQDLKQLQSRCYEMKLKYKDAHAELSLLQSCAESMPSILTGKISALEVLFPKGDSERLASLYQESPGAKLMNQMVADLVANLISKKPEGLRILEIGAGTGGTTSAILPLIKSESLHKYYFTDISSSLLSAAQNKFSDYNNVDFILLDISQKPQQQNLILESFDLIIASNVIHATPNIHDSLSNCSSLLAPGGQLILLEMTESLAFLDLIFGLTEGWWNFCDDRVDNGHALLNEDQWISHLQKSGFENTEILYPEQTKDIKDLSQSLIISKRKPVKPARYLSIGNASKHFTKQLKKQIKQHALLDDINLLANVIKQLHQDKNVKKFEILFLALQSKDSGIEKEIQQLLLLIQNLTKLSFCDINFTIITSGATGPEGSLTTPVHNALLGFLKVIRLEHPELNAHYMDLDPDIDSEQQVKSLQDALKCQGHSSAKHEGMVIRNGLYYFPQLEHSPDALKPELCKQNNHAVNLVAGDSPGLEHLQFKQAERRPPDKNEIEI